MERRELKKLWTEVAKGKISEKEARDLMNGKKTQPRKPKQGKTANTRKRSIKVQEVK